MSRKHRQGGRECGRMDPGSAHPGVCSSSPSWPMSENPPKYMMIHAGTINTRVVQNAMLRQELRACRREAKAAIRQDRHGEDAAEERERAEHVDEELAATGRAAVAKRAGHAPGFQTISGRITAMTTTPPRSSGGARSGRERAQLRRSVRRPPRRARSASSRARLSRPPAPPSAIETTRSAMRRRRPRPRRAVPRSSTSQIPKTRREGDPMPIPRRRTRVSASRTRPRSAARAAARSRTMATTAPPSEQESAGDSGTGASRTVGRRPGTIIRLKWAPANATCAC